VSELLRTEVLCIPKRRRLVHSKVKGAEGQDELHIFYGEKEIVFDEPELMTFGQRLLEVDRFRAEEAMAWSDAEHHDWEKVRELLEALLDQEILKRAAESTAAAPAKGYPERLGQAPEGREPQTFSARDDRCPFITQQAYGRPIELANLEAIVPVYRVAHPALDEEGRQVGENNVGPRSLFLDLPTQRRVCNYAGNRYQADVPMNVTALKHMTSRWPELLSLTEQFREAFFARLPRKGRALTAGEGQLLTVCCLAAVGYVMVRGVEPIPNGELDAGLAATFRIIDGVRLVTTEMMRASATEHGCDAPIDAKAIADYAERYAVYYGTYGVCAGPQALIDEYLKVLLDGAPAPVDAEPTFGARVGDLDAALDYGLHGQRLESVIRIFGGVQGLLHDRLRRAFEGAPGSKLKEILDQPIDTEHHALLRTNHPLLETLKLEVEVNRWMYTHVTRGLPETARGTESIDDLLHLDRDALCMNARELDGFLRRALPDATWLPDPLRREIASVAAEIFALERRTLRFAAREQRRINERLHRPSVRPLTGADLAIYNRVRTGPTFAVTLADGLGLAITSDAASTVLSHGDQSLSLTY
jgi:hypothetical protein